MFDRRYRITIEYADTMRTSEVHKVADLFVFEGDSSEHSLNVEFSGSVNPAGVSSNGRVVIYGLSRGLIDKFSAIRRYEYAKNAQYSNNLTLSVGYTDYANGQIVESPWYRIIGGTIIEAIPGPNPDRSLAFTLQTCHLRYYNDTYTEWLGTQISGWESVGEKGEPASSTKRAVSSTPRCRRRCRLTSMSYQISQTSTIR